VGKQHPTFNTGDVVVPTVRGREEHGLYGVPYLVVEILRGPSMRVLDGIDGKERKVMRKYFDLCYSVEERVAAALMGKE
jgi:hypothetical protein